MTLTIRLLAAGLLLLAACGGKVTPEPEPAKPAPQPAPGQQPPPNTPAPAGYDLEGKGIPQLIAANYIELAKIVRVSVFRSAEGHDYSDNFEKCRTMKHYFQPSGTTDWAQIKIYSPVTGTIVKISDEWAGKQLHIQPDNYTDFRVILFHVNPNAALQVNSKVSAGAQIGTHISNQTTSDIAVGVETTKGWKLISYFDAMNDDVFNQFKSRGIATRGQMIISKDARDADPLNCNGETFLNKGAMPGWVNLN